MSLVTVPLSSPFATAKLPIQTKIKFYYEQKFLQTSNKTFIGRIKNKLNRKATDTASKLYQLFGRSFRLSPLRLNPRQKLSTARYHLSMLLTPLSPLLLKHNTGYNSAKTSRRMHDGNNWSSNIHTLFFILKCKSWRFFSFGVLLRIMASTQFRWWKIFHRYIVLELFKITALFSMFSATAQRKRS